MAKLSQAESLTQVEQHINMQHHILTYCLKWNSGFNADTSCDFIPFMNSDS